MEEKLIKLAETVNGIDGVTITIESDKDTNTIIIKQRIDTYAMVEITKDESLNDYLLSHTMNEMNVNVGTIVEEIKQAIYKK